MTFSTATSFCTAAALALALIPLVRMLAIRLGIIDRPDLVRKLQTTPIALGGGIGVFVAMSVAFATSIYVDRVFFGRSMGSVSLHYYHLFTAALALLAIGFADDLWSMRGRQKLLAQCLVIAALVGSGTQIHIVGLFGFEYDLGPLAFPVTVLWLVIAVNALNLIDGADGMAATVGGIICLGLGFMSMSRNAPLNAAVCFALAGALLGFLWFNRPPATIYLGDSGSMMVGLMVGTLSVWTNLKDNTVLSSAPIAILAIPLFDSSAAILRRWLTGRSLYETDRGHLHHLLKERYGETGMLLLVVMLCGSTTLLSVLSVTLGSPALASAGVVLVIGLLVATRSFGYAEFRLVSLRLNRIATSFMTSPRNVAAARHSTRVPLQGNGAWVQVWEPLVAFAEQEGLASIKLDLNLAWMHEGYHGDWRSMRMPERACQMHVVVPVFAHRSTDNQLVAVGNLKVVAGSEDPSLYEKLSRLGDYLGDLTDALDAVIDAMTTREFAVPPRSVAAASAIPAVRSSLDPAKRRAAVVGTTVAATSAEVPTS